MEYKEGSFLTYVPSGEMAVEFSSDSSCSLSRHVFRVEVARKEPQQQQQERERSAFLRMQKDGQTNMHPKYRHIVRDTRTEETLLQHNITVDSVLASIPDNEGTRGTVWTLKITPDVSLVVDSSHNTLHATQCRRGIEFHFLQLL